jgi:hypothetical protein
VDEQAAEAIEPLGGEAPLLEDRPALERGNAAGHDPEGLARGVVVDGRDREGAAQIDAPTSAAQ